MSPAAGPSSGAHALRQRAEQLAATLPPVLVAAERVASSVVQGVHGRRRVGQGETFWQYRHYEAGDPIQIVDWRQSAKSDHIFARQMEWEAAQSVWIWRDISPSMDWRSSEQWQTKRERADILALALAALLVRAGERVALLGGERQPSTGRSALARLAVAIAGSGEGGPDAGLPPVLPLPRYGQAVFIGDLLSPLEAIDARVRAYAERGVRGHLLQVLDPAELALPFRGRVRFEGLEGEQPWLLSRVEPVRRAYVERMKRQQDGLRAIARAVGWTWSFHAIDRAPQTALLALYNALSANPTQGLAQGGPVQTSAGAG